MTQWWCRSLSSFVLLFIFSISFSQSIQPDKYVFVDETPVTIIKAIESGSDLKFNYIFSKLPKRTITCSIDKDKDLIKESLSYILKRSITEINDGVFAIGANELSEDELSKAEIECKIIDSKSNEPIIGATVRVASLNYGNVSDADGVVLLKGYFANSDLVEIQYLGYETKVISIGELKRGSQISISSKEHVLDDIVIKSYKNLATTKLTGDIIDPESIALPSAPDRDAFSQAQMIPGVYNSSESLQDLQIRGGPPDQVSYNWNNMRLFQNSLFYGRVSSVNPFMVDQINITRNGASADEDAAASGAINLKTDLNSIDTTSFFGHINGLYGNVGAQTSLFSDKLKVKGAFRKSLSSVFQSSIYDKYFSNTFQFGRIQDIDYYNDFFEISENVTIVPDFSFQDVSLSAQIELGNDSYIRGNYIGFGNQFTYEQIIDYKPEIVFDSLSLDTKGTSFEWHQHLTKTLSTTINYGRSDYNYSYLNTNNKIRSDQDFLTQLNSVKQEDIRARITWERTKYAVVAGYDRYDWHVIYEGDSSRPWERWFEAREDAKGREHSGYLNLQVYTKPWYKLMVGMRASSYNLAIFSRNIYEPRIHASVFANDNLTLHAHYGKFHQNLNRRKFNTNLQADNGFWLLSNEGVTTNNFIHIVQTTQMSAGVRYRFNDWTFTMDGYKKTGNDIWTSAFDFTSEEDLYEFTQLKIYGLELSAQYQNRWLSLMWTYDRVDDKIVTNESDLELNSPFTQPHRLSMYQSIRKGNWTLSSQLVYASGRYFSTPASLDTYEKDGETVNFAAYDEYLNLQVPNYFKVDLGLGYRYNISRRSKRYVEFKLQLVNLLNRKNIIKNEYYIDYRPSLPEINLHSQQGLPFIFNFSAEVRI